MLNLVSIQSMGEYQIILEHYISRKTIIRIKCTCGQSREVRVEAVHRQQQRGRIHYTCPSCAGKEGWSEYKRTQASGRTKGQWEDPQYAGTITGKAIAREIKRLSD